MGVKSSCSSSLCLLRSM